MLGQNNGHRYPVTTPDGQMHGFLDYVFSLEQLARGSYVFFLEAEIDWSNDPSPSDLRRSCEDAREKRFTVRFGRRAVIDLVQGLEFQRECWVVVCDEKDLSLLYSIGQDRPLYRSVPDIFGAGTMPKEGEIS